MNPSAELFIGRFREPQPAARSLPRTTEASSGPCPATPCPATVCPERSTKLTVVHGSENQLFGRLQNVGWSSYPERTAVKHRRVDHGGAHMTQPVKAQVAPQLWLVC
jgi:hypothetical protein